MGFFDRLRGKKENPEAEWKCPICGWTTILRVETPQRKPSACPRCGLNEADRPTDEEKALARTRAEVFDYFTNALFKDQAYSLFQWNGEGDRGQELQKSRDEIQKALAENDPQNMFVIYFNARKAGKIAACPNEDAFMKI